MTHAHANATHDPAALEHELEEHDSWFRHDANEPHHQQAHGGTHAWGIIAFMLGTLALVLAVALFTYYGAFEPLMRQAHEQAEARPLNADFATSQAAALTRFKSYEWADPAKGLVSVPLDVAKQMQLQEQLSLGTKR